MQTEGQSVGEGVNCLGADTLAAEEAHVEL
jgi:hypothetical protein